MEPRAYKSGASDTPPSPPDTPSVGFPISGNPASAIPATVPGPYRDYAIGEEIRNVITSAGLTPDIAALNQLNLAINAKIAGALNNPIGNGQEMQDLTASRAAGATYTNSTGRTIAIYVSVNPSPTLATFLVDAVDAGGAINNPDDSNTRNNFFALVPDGSTYTLSGTVQSIESWSELR